MSTATERILAKSRVDAVIEQDRKACLAEARALADADAEAERTCDYSARDTLYFDQLIEESGRHGELIAAVKDLLAVIES